MPSTSFENHLSIHIQKTDLVVLDEIILAATTSEAYEIISAGTATKSCSRSVNVFIMELGSDTSIACL